MIKDYEDDSRFPALPRDSPVVRIIRKLAILSQVYSFFFTTLAFAWTCHLLNPTTVVLTFVADSFILLHELSQFFIEVEHGFGLFTKSPLKISWNYLILNWGILRLVGAIPLENIFASGAVLSSDHCLRYRSLSDPFTLWAFIRFMRTPFPLALLVSEYFKMRVTFVSHQIGRLFKNLLFFLLFTHLDACIFWSISPLISSTKSFLVVNHLLYDVQTGVEYDFGTQYVSSFVYAAKALVFESREVSTDAEILYSVIEILIAALIYGSIFGNLANIVRHLDTEHAAQDREKVREYMVAKEFPPELQDKIVAYQNHKFQKTQGIDEALIFEDIPTSLKQDVANFLYLDMVKKVSFLQGADLSFLYSISRSVQPLTVLKGCFIFQKGDEAQEMFFIRTGSVAIVGPKGEVFVTLKPGSYFGEIAIIEGIKRTATAMAAEDTELCMLRKDVFESLLDEDSHARLMEAVAVIKERDRQKAIAAAIANGQPVPLPPPIPLSRNLSIDNSRRKSGLQARKSVAYIKNRTMSGDFDNTAANGSTTQLHRKSILSHAVTNASQDPISSNLSADNTDSNNLESTQRLGVLEIAASDNHDMLSPGIIVPTSDTVKEIKSQEQITENHQTLLNDLKEQTDNAKHLEVLSTTEEVGEDDSVTAPKLSLKTVKPQRMRRGSTRSESQAIQFKPSGSIVDIPKITASASSEGVRRPSRAIVPTAPHQRPTIGIKAAVSNSSAWEADEPVTFGKSKINQRRSSKSQMMDIRKRPSFMLSTDLSIANQEHKLAPTSEVAETSVNLVSTNRRTSAGNVLNSTTSLQYKNSMHLSTDFSQESIESRAASSSENSSKLSNIDLMKNQASVLHLENSGSVEFVAPATETLPSKAALASKIQVLKKELELLTIRRETLQNQQSIIMVRLGLEEANVSEQRDLASSTGDSSDLDLFPKLLENFQMSVSQDLMANSEVHRAKPLEKELHAGLNSFDSLDVPKLDMNIKSTARSLDRRHDNQNHQPFESRQFHNLTFEESLENNQRSRIRIVESPSASGDSLDNNRIRLINAESPRSSIRDSNLSRSARKGSELVRDTGSVEKYLETLGLLPSAKHPVQTSVRIGEDELEIVLEPTRRSSSKRDENFKEVGASSTNNENREL